ncbi:hypothetical protein CPB85DRAFT_606702 [Mucidula mucida]|nr:hypothetical protein CPB85DRAFT_606702 [Mucidula mucida]
MLADTMQSLMDAQADEITVSLLDTLSSWSNSRPATSTPRDETKMYGSFALKVQYEIEHLQQCLETLQPSQFRNRAFFPILHSSALKAAGVATAVTGAAVVAASHVNVGGALLAFGGFATAAGYMTTTVSEQRSETIKLHAAYLKRLLQIGYIAWTEFSALLQTFSATYSTLKNDAKRSQELLTFCRAFQSCFLEGFDNFNIFVDLTICDPVRSKQILAVPAEVQQILSDHNQEKLPGRNDKYSKYLGKPAYHDLEAQESLTIV